MRDQEKLRQQWRAANDRRREGTQLPMAEYRAKISAEAATRRAHKLVACEAEAAAKKALRDAQREAAKTERAARQKATQKLWREANRDRARALQKAWRDKNRPKRQTDKRARKATKRATVIRDLMRLQRGRCAYCREKLGSDFHVDHHMPLKLGGPDNRSNLQLACVPCNLSKNARHPVEFAQSLGMLL